MLEIVVSSALIKHSRLQATVVELQATVAELKARPSVKYVGSFNGGVAYSPGEIVTHGGAMWHCNIGTSDRPGTSANWTLCVKAGKDGRDLR